MKKHLFVFVLSFALTIGCSAFASCGSSDPIYEELPSYEVVDVNDTTIAKDSSFIDATKIMQNATVLSSYDYIYAFGISKMVIIGNKAYVNFGANRNKLDGDAVNNTNESCCSIVNLYDMSYRNVSPVTESKKYSDGSNAPSNTVIGYGTRTVSPDGKIVSFALLRSNNNNPYYCYAFVNPSEQKYNYVTCKLRYTDILGKEHIVDYTLNNYRQMLVDIGYVSRFIESKYDYSDNLDVNYDQNSKMYYAVVATNQNKQSEDLPLVLMNSSDMKYWYPVVNLESAYGAGEISTVKMDNILYVTYRTFTNGMRWLVYDISSKKALSEGRFDECRNVLSKPDTFMFGQNVYMAVNVYPSVYGSNYRLDPYTVRQEINIYKIVNGIPEFYRKVYNPDGINYFSFQEASNGRIYLAFSEDRRHLYKRLFSNVSFVDATDFFTEE